MHTAFLRANVVFFFAVSVLFLLSIGCGAQYFVKTPEIPCAIGQPEIARFRQYYRPAANWEHAQGSFHLDADFRPMWNWNTMQVFVYVVVEWESDMRTNRVVVWDREIQTPKDARINQVMDLEYTINDQFAQLRGRELRMMVEYDIMPIVGILKTEALPQCSTTFNMPTTYIM